MVSAPPRPSTPPSTAPRARFAPVRIPLPEGAVGWEDLVRFRNENPGYRFERYGKNELVITLGSGWNSEERASDILIDLGLWKRAVAGGHVAGSSALTESDDGSLLIADVAWISDERRAASGGATDEGPAGVPEFVVEVMSWSDRPLDQKRKMERWIARGVLLGWLIDPYDRIVWIYRPGRVVEELHEPAQLSGDPELPGFVAQLDAIWAERND